MAEICLKIDEKNQSFPEKIASGCRKIFTLLLTSKKSIVGFLEFFTLLFNNSRANEYRDLIKFAVFEMYEKNWLKGDDSEKNSKIILEFIDLNSNELVKRVPYYLIGDFYFILKDENENFNKILSERSKKFDPDLLTIDTENSNANPSLKYAMNEALILKDKYFLETIYELEDIRVFKPHESAKFFTDNLTVPKFAYEDHFVQSRLVELLKFKFLQNEKNSKTFMTEILNILKRNFHEQHVAFINGPSENAARGTTSTICELLKHDVLPFANYKVFLKIMSNRIMADETTFVEYCHNSIFKKGYTEQLMRFSEESISRFIHCAVKGSALARRTRYEAGINMNLGLHLIKRRERRIMKNMADKKADEIRRKVVSSVKVVRR